LRDALQPAIRFILIKLFLQIAGETLFFPWWSK
jgi:hypothetical protein